MDKITHTPTPWEFNEASREIYYRDRNEYHPVVECFCKQDAEYICLAVNEREKLLKDREGLVGAAKGALWALREIKKDLSYMNDYEDDHPEKEWPDIVALGQYHMSKEKLCCVCAGGKWHDKFPRKFYPLGTMKTDKNGNLTKKASK